MCVSDRGTLRVMTSSGCTLWSNAWADRIPDLSTYLAEYAIGTDLSASPCGRWVLVIDVANSEGYVTGAQRVNTLRITLLEASTGRILAANVSHVPIPRTDITWSTSGKICLLGQLCLVLVCRQHADPFIGSFQSYKLMGGLPFAVGLFGDSMSLSPCGSTVIGRRLGAPDLKHWQIPSSPYIIQEAASAPDTLPLLSLTGFTSALQADHIVYKAWHPLHSACVYAIATIPGTVHLIDAKANRCVRSWSQNELHGPTTSLDSAQVDKITPADEQAREMLSWSKDGRRLAVASRTCPARCSVLYFSGGFA